MTAEKLTSGDKGHEKGQLADPLLHDRKNVENQFDHTVKILLGEGWTHKDMKARVRQLVLAKGEKLPTRKVLYCKSYGLFRISKRFKFYLKKTTCIDFRTEWDQEPACARDDPILIKAIGDFGRSICDEVPYIFKDWRLAESLSLRIGGITIDADPIVEAQTPLDSNTLDQADSGKAADGHDLEVEFGKDDFVTFAKRNPDSWMQHSVLVGDGDESQVQALQHAHTLLTGNHPRYHVDLDETQDASIYERVGLLAASTSLSQLAISQVPALVDYTIHEYDGLETVMY